MLPSKKRVRIKNGQEKPKNTRRTGQPSPKQQSPNNIHITAKQSAIASLLESRTITAAAEQAQVAERTLRRWLLEDTDFQHDLRNQLEAELNQPVLRSSSTFAARLRGWSAKEPAPLPVQI